MRNKMKIKTDVEQKRIIAFNDRNVMGEVENRDTVFSLKKRLSEKLTYKDSLKKKSITKFWTQHRQPEPYKLCYFLKHDFFTFL